MMNKSIYRNSRGELTGYAMSCGHVQRKYLNDYEIDLVCESPSAQVYRVCVRDPDGKTESTFGQLGPMRRLWREKVKAIQEEACISCGT